MFGTEYLNEKHYVLSRLWFVAFIALGTLLFFNVISIDNTAEKFTFKIGLIVLTFLSWIFYRFIIKYPNKFIDARKTLLLLIDISLLTATLWVLKSNGFYLLPIYIIIVMMSSAYLGFMYLYISLLFSSVSWIFLVKTSSYWHTSENVIVLFALTSFVVAFLYSKHLTSLYEQQEELHENLEHSNYDANFDELTGLANRKQYHAYMQELFQEETFFALLFIDLNKFKPINDTYGHDVGDKVLIETANRLKESIDEEDFIARLGGDEFVIITKRKKAFLDKFIENLERTVIGYHYMGDVIVLIDLSIGISLYPDDSKTETFLRKCADEAMYVAKNTKDRSHVFYEELKASENFS